MTRRPRSSPAGRCPTSSWAVDAMSSSPLPPEDQPRPPEPPEPEPQAPQLDDDWQPYRPTPRSAPATAPPRGHQIPHDGPPRPAFPPPVNGPQPPPPAFAAPVAGPQPPPPAPGVLPRRPTRGPKQGPQHRPQYGPGYDPRFEQPRPP